MKMKSRFRDLSVAREINNFFGNRPARTKFCSEEPKVVCYLYTGDLCPRYIRGENSFSMLERGRKNTGCRHKVRQQHCHSSDGLVLKRCQGHSASRLF